MNTRWRQIVRYSKSSMLRELRNYQHAEWARQVDFNGPGNWDALSDRALDILSLQFELITRVYPKGRECQQDWLNDIADELGELRPGDCDAD